MNLGNQNSKYSWRIRDLENPQTGTQFTNSVLMYKMIDYNVQVGGVHDYVNTCFIAPIDYCEE